MTECGGPIDGEPVTEAAVAYHEAGHAVQFLLEGCEVELVELSFGADNHGRAKPSSASSVRLSNCQHVRISLAGIAAEFVAKRLSVPSNPDGLFEMVDRFEGWEPDWGRAHYYALQVVGEGKFEAADQLLFRQFQRVMAVQTDHKAKVALVAERLLSERRLSGDALTSLLSRPTAAVR
jgi:hypothetical protein